MLMMLTSILKTAKNLLRKILPQPGFDLESLALPGKASFQVFRQIICCLHMLALQCVAPY